MSLTFKLPIFRNKAFRHLVHIFVEHVEKIWYANAETQMVLNAIAAWT